MELMITQQQLLTAETAVIGSLLIDPEHVIGEVMQQLTSSHFLTPELRHLFEVIRGLWIQQQPVDAITVLDAAGRGYESTLRRIMDATPTAANVGRYIEIVKKLSRTAQLQALFAEGAQADDLEELGKIMERANRLLAERQDVRVVSLQQGIVEFCQWQQDPAPAEYLPTGIAKLTKQADIERGDYVLIGGTPSSGKTAFALQIAKHAAGRGYRVGFFSLETRSKKLVNRAVAQNAAVDLASIKHKRLQPSDWDRVTAFGHAAGRINLDLIEAAGMSATDIQAYTVARRYDVIVIDYVQLIREKAPTRYETVTNISMELHTLAQANNVTVIGLAQLSRPEKDSKEGPKKAPSMADFKESGQLEQDADVAMILRQEDKDQNRRRIWVVKNKEGDKGYVDLHFAAAEMRFSAMSAWEDDDAEETNSRGFRKAVAPPKREVQL